MKNNQSINNMELVLEKVEKEFVQGNYQAVKTLMNTYRNILKQFRNDSTVNRKKTSVRDELQKQFSKLSEILTEAEGKVQSELLNGHYKGADNVVQSIERIKSSQQDLMWVLSHPKDLKNTTI